MLNSLTHPLQVIPLSQGGAISVEAAGIVYYWSDTRPLEI